jgi:hypothetical protein
VFFDPSEATEIEMTFIARDNHTAVRLEQRGWDALGEAAPSRRIEPGRPGARSPHALSTATAAPAAPHEIIRRVALNARPAVPPIPIATSSIAA